MSDALKYLPNLGKKVSLYVRRHRGQSSNFNDHILQELSNDTPYAGLIFIQGALIGISISPTPYFSVRFLRLRILRKHPIFF